MSSHRRITTAVGLAAAALAAALTWSGPAVAATSHSSHATVTSSTTATTSKPRPSDWVW